MKKSIICIGIALFATFNGISKVEAANDNPLVERGKEHKAPARRLQVNFENSAVVIWSPTTIYNVDIIIRDVMGGIIYQDCLPEIFLSYTIALSEEESAEVYSIELAYGDQHLTMYVD